MFTRASVCDESEAQNGGKNCPFSWKTGTQGVSFQVKVSKSETNKTVGQGRHTVKKNFVAKRERPGATCVVPTSISATSTVVVTSIVGASSKLSSNAIALQNQSKDRI